MCVCVCVCVVFLILYKIATDTFKDVLCKVVIQNNILHDNILKL